MSMPCHMVCQKARHEASRQRASAVHPKDMFYPTNEPCVLGMQYVAFYSSWRSPLCIEILNRVATRAING